MARERFRRSRTQIRGDRPREERKLQRIAGLPAVTALFSTAPERVDRLYFIDALKEAAGPFCITLAKRHRQYRLARPDEMERIAGTAMHGGILALAEPRAIPDLDVEAAGTWAKAGEPLLILDGVGNPHNLGAIARTAAFFGLARLVLSDHPAQALPSDASYRVAEGGLDHLEIFRARRFPLPLKALARHYHILGTALEGGRPPSSLSAAGTDKPVALVLGNEEHGLSRATLERCAGVVTIPGSGLVQSLNVAATAAILIHGLLVGAATRTRTRSGPD
jgi:TrmH RNA methyltransferase